MYCRTLGELALYADPTDAEPLFRAGKSLAMLVYVALTPQRTESRDRIIALFWPGTPPSQAHHTLRQALYRLRRSANHPTLIELQENVVRCSDGVRLDCFEAEEALAAEDVDRAWDLLRGDFFHGLSFPESREVEEWIEVQRTRFRECQYRTGECVIERAWAEGRPDRALEVALELEAVDPSDERRVRALMSALDRTGQTRRALAEFEAYVSLVLNGFDDEPSAELRDYAQELKRSLTAPQNGSSTALPFVGRCKPWSALLNSWSAVEGGRCAVVLVEGDLGLGKTRLVEEFSARALAAGATWLSGKCYEMEQNLPYSVISDLLHSAPSVEVTAAGDESGSPGRLVAPPDLLTLAEATASPEDPHGELGGNGGLRLHSSVRRWLSELAADRPLLVTCDDIHWADPASLQLLHSLSHQLERVPLLIICTYRPAELSPDARRFAASLASQGLARLVILEPLGVEAVLEILQTLGHFSDPEMAATLAADLHRHTGGNPMFIAELLEALERRGLVRLESGEWVAGGSLRAEELPNRLRTVLAERVDGVPPDLRFILEAMAVIADAEDVDLVADVTGCSTPVTEMQLAELARARLVKRLPYGRFAVAHDEVRQLVYSAIPDDRRREMHRKVGEAMEARGEVVRPGGAARLARHFEQAGEIGKARELALAAASEAAAIGATAAEVGFLKMADAFEPAGAERRSLPRLERVMRGRRRWLPLAAATVGAAAIITAFLLDGRKAETSTAAALQPWQQGHLYVHDSQTGADGTLGFDLYRVHWPARPEMRATLKKVDRWPQELPAPIILRPDKLGEETHYKLHRVAGSDTIQLTHGHTDDDEATWSPDRRLIAYRRGWREGEDYRFNIFVIDTIGRPVWQVTDTPYQDDLLAWSPDGSRLTIQRTVNGQASVLLLDTDGRRPKDLTRTYALPQNLEWVASFSPDGRRLAAAHTEADAIWIIDLARGGAERIPIRCDLHPWPLLWSPDGKWITFRCLTAEAAYLSFVSMDGGRGPHMLLRLEANMYPAAWVVDLPRYVAAVDIWGDTADLRSGSGIRLSASALDRDGRRVFSPIRWQCLDTTNAYVDSTGFVKGRRQGWARIIASAGGFRADTALLRIVPTERVDTLLHETWSEGIDTLRWRVISTPRPEVIARTGPLGSPALKPNGDHNWPSGVLSREEFDVSDGLTLEISVRFRFTGLHWQELEVALAPLAAALIAGERRPGGWIAAWMFNGSSPRYAHPHHVCASTETWDVETANAGWHHAVLQVRPDGIVECFLDGRFSGLTSRRDTAPPSKAGIWLGGRSNRTDILIGPVLVTRGLRY